MNISSPTARMEAGLYLPENASFLTRLVVAVRALNVLKDVADDPIAAPLLNACLDTRVYDELSRKMWQTDDGREMLTRRPSLQGASIDLKLLAQLPDGTLGRETARFFERNNLYPFESPYEVRNDVDYLSKRYRETHDIAHLLTGYGVDVMGELELQAFMVGNLGIRTGVLILFFAVTTGVNQEPWGSFVRKLWAAYRRGQQSEQLIRLRYEQWWEKSVEDVRQDLRLPPLKTA